MGTMLRYNIEVVRVVDMKRTVTAKVSARAANHADAALSVSLLLGETSWTWAAGRWSEGRNLSETATSWFFVEVE